MEIDTEYILKLEEDKSEFNKTIIELKIANEN
jgi:hypothetical protein